MKISKRQLRRIIKEEKAKLTEQFQGSMMDLDDHNKLVQQVDGIIMRMMTGPRGATGYTREDIIFALKDILKEI